MFMFQIFMLLNIIDFSKGLIGNATGHQCTLKYIYIKHILIDNYSAWSTNYIKNNMKLYNSFSNTKKMELQKLRTYQINQPSAVAKFLSLPKREIAITHI